MVVMSITEKYSELNKLAYPNSGYHFSLLAIQNTSYKIMYLKFKFGFSQKLPLL